MCAGKVKKYIFSSIHQHFFLQVVLRPSVKAVSSTAAMDRHLSAAPTTPMSEMSSRKLMQTHSEASFCCFLL